MITVVGESLVDVVRRPDGTVSEHPGGSPANVAVGLARLGTSVELVTHLGDDARGRLVTQHLRDNGVATAGPVDGVTSVAEATLDRAGAASYDFRITWDLDPDLPPPSTGCLHTGSIATMLAPGADAVEALVGRARDTATVSYDPNVRPSLAGDVEPARRRVERFVGLSDVVKVSDEDLAWLAPGTPYDEVARRWLASGPALVVVTRGGEGSYAVCAAGAVSVASPRVDVVDTVGAGDAFTAGLLDALRRRDLLGADARESLRAVDVPALEAVLGEAALVAAVTVSRPGADPPTAAELAALR